MAARHLPDRVTGSLSSARGIAWVLTAAVVVAVAGCAHAVDESFADGLDDSSSRIDPVANGLDASAPVVAAKGADVGSRVAGLTFDASADETIDAGVVSANDGASSAVASDAGAPTAPVATTAPASPNSTPAPTTSVNDVPTAAPTTPAPADTAPASPTAAPTSTTAPVATTDASLPNDASTAERPAVAPSPTSPPVTTAPPAATCEPAACTNLCLPYFVSCCKADATCGCALLFPRGPCD